MKIETKKGLWVSSSFTEKFGNKDIQPAQTVPAFKKLERNMHDSEIKKEFGMEECTLGDVAAFLKNPPEGCNDGYWNIFYVAGCVVRVGWLSVDRRWGVGSWRLGVGSWSAGSRAFGRNRLSEPLASSGASSGSLTLSRSAVEADHEQRIVKLEKMVQALKDALYDTD